jgi:hypothetical protein
MERTTTAAGTKFGWLTRVACYLAGAALLLAGGLALERSSTAPSLTPSSSPAFQTIGNNRGDGGGQKKSDDRGGDKSDKGGRGCGDDRKSDDHGCKPKPCKDDKSKKADDGKDKKCRPMSGQDDDHDHGRGRGDD